VSGAIALAREAHMPNRNVQLILTYLRKFERDELTPSPFDMAFARRIFTHMDAANAADRQIGCHRA
jgi:hypothetical protein